MRTLLPLLLVGLLLTGVTLTGCSKQENSGVSSSQDSTGVQNTYEDINAEQAKELMEKNKELLILDVREPNEYAEGHIKGAVLVPMGELESKLPELDKSKTVLVYCLTGARSAAASEYLVANGFAQVKNLSGGVANWTYDLER